MCARAACVRRAWCTFSHACCMMCTPDSSTAFSQSAPTHARAMHIFRTSSGCSARTLPAQLAHWLLRDLVCARAVACCARRFVHGAAHCVLFSGIFHCIMHSAHAHAPVCTPSAHALCTPVGHALLLPLNCPHWSHCEVTMHYSINPHGVC